MITALVLFLIAGVATIFAIVWVMGGNKRTAASAARQSSNTISNGPSNR